MFYLTQETLLFCKQLKVICFCEYFYRKYEELPDHKTLKSKREDLLANTMKICLKNHEKQHLSAYFLMSKAIILLKQKFSIDVNKRKKEI